MKYKGCLVKECLEAPVAVFQDGYIQCDMEHIRGCQWCYERLEKRMQSQGCVIDLSLGNLEGLRREDESYFKR